MIKKILFKLSRYSSSRIILELIYFYKDPWGLKSAHEIERYKFINSLLMKKNHNKKFNNILEIGCGEGYHSSYLKDICNNLHSIDISAIAISRAKKNNNFKNVKFQQLNFEKINNYEHYDLVVASEVIFYSKKYLQFLKKIENIKCNLLISYYSYERKKLKKLFMKKIYTITSFFYKNIEWDIIYK